MKTRAREWALEELLKARDKKQLKQQLQAEMRKRVKIDQECVDVTAEVKAELSSEHELGEALHKLDIEALDIKISYLKAMLIADSVDMGEK
tara:strand:+ start:20731 stop:21003 length:273 start_codon:yes stop_codon:yes gene_type:complete